MARKKFRYTGKLIDVSKLRRDNETIRSDIRHFLEILPRLRQRFRRRYIDDSDIETILDAIDFSKIHANHGRADVELRGVLARTLVHGRSRTVRSFAGSPRVNELEHGGLLSRPVVAVATALSGDVQDAKSVCALVRAGAKLSSG